MKDILVVCLMNLMMIKQHMHMQTMEYQVDLALWPFLGEIYFRENDGFRDFNGPVDPNGAISKHTMEVMMRGEFINSLRWPRFYGNCQLI